jgi:glycosyltransferase involved in cell wall biosynthesis
VADVLYITYDGLTDPLGRSQILPYLQGCAARDHRITILSCEKPDRLRKNGGTVAELCREANIDWQPLRYHRRPPVVSTVYDTWMLTRAAAALHRERGFDLIHCRSYISAIAGLRLKRSRGVPLLFDMRGFWPEEKTESGAWDLRNPLYRAVYKHFKRLESDLLRESDHIISLTEAAKRQLLSRPECAGHPDRISVIPCCVDFDHFPLAESYQDEARAELGIERNARVLAYLGSLGGNYMLDEMLDFFRIYVRQHPAAIFLFVTIEEPRSIREAARRRGVDPARIVIRAAGREEVPATIAAADAGIAFKQPSFSALACSPTKLGEMLAMGIPVVANAGVGDVTEVIENCWGGAIVHCFDEQSYAAAIARVEALPAGAADIRRAALVIFDLKRGIRTYDLIYRAMVNTLATRSGGSGFVNNSGSAIANDTKREIQ